MTKMQSSKFFSLHKLAGAAASVAALLLLLCSPSAHGQNATGQIAGRVADSSGATVPGATVTVTNTQTNDTRRITTGADGLYSVSQLQPGAYQIKVEAANFSTEVVNVSALQVNQTISEDVALKVGSASTTVEVSASGEVLQTASAELGAVVDPQEVHDVPLNGRNFTQLITLVPGATPVSTGQAAHIGTGPISTLGIPGSSFAQPAVQGQWNRMNYYTLDGAINVASISSSYDVLPIIDSIEEFKVQSHSDQAEFGSVLGGVINVVTKGGTNDVHGTAWEYLRNSAFDASNPFSGLNKLHQNQFGATVGGPVWIPKLYNGRNRTFFYFGYEGWRYSSPNGSTYLTVPTAAELAGDFSNSLLPNPIYDPTKVPRTQFAGNVIPTNRIDTTTQKFLTTYLDTPNTQNPADPTLNDLVNAPLINTNDTYNVRIDERLGSKDSFFFRYTRMNYAQSSPDSNKSTSIANEKPVNYAVGITHLFTSNLLVDGHFGYSDLTFVQNDLPNANVPTIAAAGFGSLVNPGYPSFSLGSPYSGMGGGDELGYLSRANKNFSASANVSYTRGVHNLRAGLQFMFLGYSCCVAGTLYPGTTQYTFSNNQTSNGTDFSGTGNGLASALLSYPSGISTSSQTFNVKYGTYAPYIEDQWKISDKLTMNLGFRVDHFATPSVTNHGLLSEFDPNTGNWDIGTSTPLPQCVPAAAPCIPTGSGYATTTGSTGIGVSAANHIVYLPISKVLPQATWNYGPRIGIAYVAGPKTVVRAGFGIVYDTLSGNLQTIQADIGAWPDSSETNVNYNPTTPTTVPTTTVESSLSNQGLRLPSPTPFTSGGSMYDPKLKAPTSNQWNLELQRQLTADSSLEIAYVGSSDHRLPVTGLFNVGTPGSQAADRPYPYYGASTDMAFSNGWSNFNALETKLQGRYAKSLNLLVSYTYSKSLDVASGYYGGENGAGGTSPQSLSNLKGEYAPSGFNITNFLSISALYDLPFGPGKPYLNHGIAAYVLGSWQLNTTTSARSGQPYSVYANGDIAQISPGGTSSGYERADVVGNPGDIQKNKNHWFNPAAFAVPATGTFGNSSRDAYTSPSVYNSDLSLFKAFEIRERAKVQFRAEAFNFLNKVNLGTPASDVSTPNGFGTISGIASGTNPRQIQLGLRVEF